MRVERTKKGRHTFETSTLVAILCASSRFIVRCNFAFPPDFFFSSLDLERITFEEVAKCTSLDVRQLPRNQRGMTDGRPEEKTYNSRHKPSVIGHLHLPLHRFTPIFFVYEFRRCNGRPIYIYLTRMQS